MLVSSATIDSIRGMQKSLPGSLCSAQQSRIYLMQFQALEFRKENALGQQVCAAVDSPSVGGKKNRGSELSAIHQMCDFGQAT